VSEDSDSEREAEMPAVKTRLFRRLLLLGLLGALLLWLLVRLDLPFTPIFTAPLHF
jgi:hypothetical protein